MVTIESTQSALNPRGVIQPKITSSTPEKEAKISHERTRTYPDQVKRLLATDAHGHTRTGLKNYQPRTHTNINSGSGFEVQGI